MAVASPTISRSTSSSAPDSASTSAVVSPDLNGLCNSSRSQEDVEFQSAAGLKSEEYRQLFRLPPDEVLIEDFNCACQENILIQGHMYLFIHYICFYSNIFGFETKKVIPFEEVTGVQRAKTAGIFPNAIEIIAGDKKHFFASFLSRDEAFKIINEGWLRHGNAAQAMIEKQESVIESNSRENGHVTQMAKGSGEIVVDDTADRNGVDPDSRDSEVPSIVEDNTVSTEHLEVLRNAKEAEQAIVNSSSSSQENDSTWKEENSNAPEIPESYARVAESRFSIKVEDFFSFFFSDDSLSFTEFFHKRCGDKDFRCSRWYPDKENGRARDVSFQHPIKIYLGAKLGSCQELQKFRVYKDSHLVVETSQEINDVPYGDYFCVQGLWDVERDNSKATDCCILRVYVNVAFSKKTMWKGKIVQSTLEECKETYSIWIDTAHELLKQKRLERQEAGPSCSMVQNHEVQLETGAEAQESLKVSNEAYDRLGVQQRSNYANVNQQVDGPPQGSYSSHSGESIKKLISFLGNQKQLPLVLTITFIMIILMQVSILVLLGRPQNVHVISPVGHGNGLGSGAMYHAHEWLEKRMLYLKDEMLIIEARLERMQHEHALLKAQLKDIEQLKNHR